MTKPIWTDSQWTMKCLHEVFNEIEAIGHGEMGLDTYPNQIEIIGSEQMLDAYCVTPDHLILTKDLHWIPAGEATVGMNILGFDENGPFRSYRSAVISRVELAEEPVFEVLLSSGHKIKATAEHKWLVRMSKGQASRLDWKRTDELRGADTERYTPHRIPKVLDVWSEFTTKESGWLAGMFDEEGNILRGGLHHLGLAQNSGPVLDEVVRLIRDQNHEVTVRNRKHDQCKRVAILGEVRNRLQFLGENQPKRLINNMSFDRLGLMKTDSFEEVVSVTPIGIRTIVKITTSTGTMIVDGYPMHNCSIGMPIMYNHWSFGKSFVREQESYKQGRSGLAYELVINSDPCVNYLMEDNTMTLQALVLAHAGMGHNHFFKNNYLFRQWTDAAAIVDYLVFARDYVTKCEQKYGESEVAAFLDSAHALMDYGVNRYHRPSKVNMNIRKEMDRQKDEYLQSRVSELDRIAPRVVQKNSEVDPEDRDFPEHPEENLLYFCEKYGDIKGWQRELIRIVRKVAQYFYPQSQTKIMNEGFASTVHYKIMNRLHEKGLTTDGAHLEFLSVHSGVLNQPKIGSPHYSGFNPYKLGFEMMRDMERICSNPTEEDRRWFPDMVGQDPWQTVKDSVVNYRDESFILQFLSPKVIRDFGMFHVYDEKVKDHFVVKSIHDDRGYQRIREKLAEMQEWDTHTPVIEVKKWSRKSRTLHLRHTDRRSRSLSVENRTEMMYHVSQLWGGPVELMDREARQTDLFEGLI